MKKKKIHAKGMKEIFVNLTERKIKTCIIITVHTNYIGEKTDKERIKHFGYWNSKENLHTLNK